MAEIIGFGHGRFERNLNFKTKNPPTKIGGFFVFVLL